MKVKRLLAFILLLAIILVPWNEVIEAREVEANPISRNAYPNSINKTIYKRYKGMYESAPNRVSYSVTINYRVYKGSLYKRSWAWLGNDEIKIKYTGTLYYNSNIKPGNQELLK